MAAGVLRNINKNASAALSGAIKLSSRYNKTQQYKTPFDDFREQNGS